MNPSQPGRSLRAFRFHAGGSSWWVRTDLSSWTNLRSPRGRNLTALAIIGFGLCFQAPLASQASTGSTDQPEIGRNPQQQAQLRTSSSLLANAPSAPGNSPADIPPAPAHGKGALTWELVGPETRSSIDSIQRTAQPATSNPAGFHSQTLANRPTPTQPVERPGLVWELVTPEPERFATTSADTHIAAADLTTDLPPTSEPTSERVPIVLVSPIPAAVDPGEFHQIALASASGNSEPLPQQPAAPGGRLVWELVMPGESLSEPDVAREIQEADTMREQIRNQVVLTSQAPHSSWIIGLGGGARIGLGEPTFSMLYGRLGWLLDDDIAISLRPTYIFGNSDSEGKSNNEGAFQMPLTIDFLPNYWISPYFGAGIAANTDSNGDVNLMISGGLEIRLTKNITFAAGLNYISQPSDTDDRDIEGLTALYIRF